MLEGNLKTSVVFVWSSGAPNNWGLLPPKIGVVENMIHYIMSKPLSLKGALH